MNFLELIRPHLCHDSDRMSIIAFVNQPPAVKCETCHQTPIPNVYHFIREAANVDLLGACHLAQMYHILTGDEQVPVPFALVSVEGILPKHVDDQPIRRLYASVKILKALNAPFTQNATMDAPTEEMQHFLTDYMHALTHAQPQEALKDSEKMVLNHLLQNLHQAMESKEFQENKFDFYFQKLVPYVKACRKDWTPLPPEEEESNLIKQLLNQLQRSMAIRKMFSRYCIPFDIFHVLVGCYACCSDIGMVANWALDLMARICRGQFVWKEYESCAFVQQILRGIKSDVSYKRNTDLYYVMRSIQKGEGIECLSENFAKYGQLEKMVKEKIQAPSDLVEMVTHQLFPNVLFDHHADQLAFNIAMGHVACSMDLKTAQVKKRAFAKARRLYGIVCKLVKQVQAFDVQYPIPWTIDTLKLFMVSDANIEKNLTEIPAVVFEPNKEK
ncbi:uncharacterized protein TNCT_422131 [Trichonephila clavata]|uniref:Uncharacterized protein n=1 Tax=Trichonephila clavata TaxID=2740835 RepID=A0A8X6J846_TRICU|nr:uncharacterized protein TNCT_422131 [Trichonephila clavata]